MIKIKNKKIVALFIFGVILISGFSLVNGYKYLFSDFEGVGTAIGDPEECHESVAPESIEGYIEIVSIVGTSFDGGDNFTISAKIINFSEAVSQSVVLGFANGNPGRGDNKEFTFNVSYIDVNLDVTGSSNPFYFEVIGPNATGNYTLVADALWNDGDTVIQFTTGGLILEFTYEDPPNGDPGDGNGDPGDGNGDPGDNDGNDSLDQALIFGYNTISILIYIFGIVMFISSMRKRKRIK
jgi:hypothetical protein